MSLGNTPEYYHLQLASNANQANDQYRMADNQKFKLLTVLSHFLMNALVILGNNAPNHLC